MLQMAEPGRRLGQQHPGHRIVRGQGEVTLQGQYGLAQPALAQGRQGGRRRTGGPIGIGLLGIGQGGPVGIAGQGQLIAEGAPSLGQIAPQLPRLAQLGDGRLAFAEPRQGQPQFVMGVGRARVDLHHPAKEGPRLHGVALAPPRGGENEHRAGVVGKEFQDLARLPLGGGRVALQQGHGVGHGGRGGNPRGGGGRAHAGRDVWPAALRGAKS